jgi:hypothetical protein
MAKWPEAPDGQPTENIELQLRTAEGRLDEAVRWQGDCERRLASAVWMVGSYSADRERLTWQLEQRKKREGLGHG